MTTPAENAEILGLQALAWLAQDVKTLERFMNSCGIDATALRDAADRPETAAAVLDFLLADEALLVAFCDSADIAPKALHLARHRLDGES